VTTTRLSSYDAVSNRITGMTENAAALRNYAYDGAGNIVTDTRPGEIFAFSYNARNRPASVTRNSVAYASYSYNAFEQLVARSTTAPGGPSGTVHYIHDRQDHIIAEADAATGAVTRDYIWMAANDNEPTDLPLVVAEGANLYAVHTDHLGRPTAMTDAAKSTVWQAAYNPHGEAASLSGSVALNLRFPGQYFQIETALSYNWHRHYDAVTGRYTQPDPLRFVDGPSIYAYAGNSPLRKVDPAGLTTSMVCRTVQDWRTKLFGAKHCGVFVWHWEFTGCEWRKIIDSQFTLAGGTSPQTDPNAPSSRMDRDAFSNPGDRDEHYEINPPSGQSQSDFDRSVTQSGNNYSQPPYSSVFGPNSNTAADNIIEGAGGIAPDVPGAFHQNWGEPPPQPIILMISVMWWTALACGI
jgi:RHS repeat-associated protein